MDSGEELDYEPADEDVTTFRATSRPWRTTATNVNLYESKWSLYIKACRQHRIYL